jgi:hypothetical protein
LRERHVQWMEWLRNTVGEISPDPSGQPSIFDALETRMAGEEYRGCAFINTIVEMANPDHAAHILADEHKQKLTAYIGEVLKQVGFSEYKKLAGRFVILVDGAIVTALREGTNHAAQEAKQIAAILLSASKKQLVNKRRR